MLWDSFLTASGWLCVYVCVHVHVMCVHAYICVSVCLMSNDKNMYRCVAPGQRLVWLHFCVHEVWLKHTMHKCNKDEVIMGLVCNTWHDGVLYPYMFDC